MVGLQIILSFIYSTNGKRQIIVSVWLHTIVIEHVRKNRHKSEIGIRDYLKGPNNLLNLLKPQNEYRST